MLDIQPYRLDDANLAAAADFLRQSMDGQERLFEQLGSASLELQATGNASRFLYVRYGLMEYIAGAYATRDRPAFDSAVATLHRYRPASGAGGYRPTAAQLGFDLAVALSCRQEQQAHELGSHILRDTPDDDTVVPEDLQARTLAQLWDLDYGGAGRTLDRMRKLLDTVKSPAHERAILKAWVNAAECVAAQAEFTLAHDLLAISDARTRYVDKMLARWRKGQNTELSALDFWDPYATALVVVARSFGLAGRITPAALPFADWRWTEGAQAWA